MSNIPEETTHLPEKRGPNNAGNRALGLILILLVASGIGPQRPAHASNSVVRPPVDRDSPTNDNKSPKPYRVTPEQMEQFGFVGINGEADVVGYGIGEQNESIVLAVGGPLGEKNHVVLGKLDEQGELQFLNQDPDREPQSFQVDGLKHLLQLASSDGVIVPGDIISYKDESGNKHEIGVDPGMVEYTPGSIGKPGRLSLKSSSVEILPLISKLDIRELFLADAEVPTHYLNNLNPAVLGLDGISFVDEEGEIVSLNEALSGMTSDLVIGPDQVKTNEEWRKLLRYAENNGSTIFILDGVTFPEGIEENDSSAKVVYSNLESALLYLSKNPDANVSYWLNGEIVGLVDKELSPQERQQLIAQLFYLVVMLGLPISVAVKLLTTKDQQTNNPSPEPGQFNTVIQADPRSNELSTAIGK